MRVLQIAQRPLIALAAAAVVLTGCGKGDSEPTYPFNPSGASADMAAAGATFDSPVYASFSQLSFLFDDAVGGSLVSGSAAALSQPVPGSRLQTAYATAAERIGRMLPRTASGSFVTASVAIPATLLGETFVYSGGTYVVSGESGAPANGVRFMLYDLDPATLLPSDPLVEIGHVDVIDFSSGTTSAARVIVVAGGATYLDYRVTVTSTSTAGKITVVGLISDANTAATFNVTATVNSAGSFTLVESLAIPERDLSLRLSMTSSGTTPETSVIGITLDMRGGNGWVRLIGQFTQDGGTLNVLVNGTQFATITESVGAPTAIIGVDGQPLAPDELAALEDIFSFTGEAFLVFSALITPVATLIGI
jgi:hypothetical protein